MSKQLKINFEKSEKKGRLSSVLDSKEKLFLYGAIIILLGSLIAWTLHFYYSSTEKKPEFGGEYTEGVVGEPMYVNPLLSQSNEIDSALSNLVFSSLLKYDENARLENDLAENYELSEDKRVYTFKIREDALWHDGEKLTAEDVYFTARLIQNPSFKSSLRGDWERVEPEIIDDYTIKFTLEEPHAAFLNNFTFGVLPKHAFNDISADKFLITELNLRPVGSGPFVFSDYEKDKQDNIISYQLVSNKEYYNQEPYLQKINFNFYSNEEALFDAYVNKEINGLGVPTYGMIEKFEDRKDTKIRSMRTPSYFAVFLNQTKSIALADEKVREAIHYGTNKKEIINDIFNGHAVEASSPILDNFGAFQTNPDIEKITYDPEKAKNILEEAGWVKNDNEIRQKEDEELSISIITTQWTALQQTADSLKTQWQKLGIKVDIANLPISEFQQNFIRPRDYEALLFGQSYIGNDPDPYLFWHSSGKKDPGKNIALYEDKDVDKLLEDARKTHDLEKRREYYREFEDIISKDYPALFLYSPNYIYITNKKIKGVDTESLISPPYRFSQANEWYINTKREKKN